MPIIWEAWLRGRLPADKRALVCCHTCTVGVWYLLALNIAMLKSQSPISPQLYTNLCGHQHQATLQHVWQQM